MSYHYQLCVILTLQKQLRLYIFHLPLYYAVAFLNQEKYFLKLKIKLSFRLHSLQEYARYFKVLW